jgi:hypothetical protein
LIEKIIQNTVQDGRFTKVAFHELLCSDNPNNELFYDILQNKQNLSQLNSASELQEESNVECIGDNQVNNDCEYIDGYYINF